MYNLKYGNPTYTGYMSGGTGSLSSNRANTINSTIKGTIDTWYVNNLNANYGKYLSTTAVYCNSRNLRSGDTYNSSSSFYYVGYERLVTSKTPSYDCEITEDKFTVDTSTGNGKLTYPIVLMTADEVSYAGGVYSTNAPTWYYYNSIKGSSTGSTYWWLMSPYNWNSNFAFVFFIYGSNFPGNLVYNGVNSNFGIRPVISIKGDNLWKSGDGTASSPYEIVTD